jgi:hypothetical protein
MCDCLYVSRCIYTGETCCRLCSHTMWRPGLDLIALTGKSVSGDVTTVRFAIIALRLKNPHMQVLSFFDPLSDTGIPLQLFPHFPFDLKLATLDYKPMQANVSNMLADVGQPKLAMGCDVLAELILQPESAWFIQLMCYQADAEVVGILHDTWLC